MHVQSLLIRARVPPKLRHATFSTAAAPVPRDTYGQQACSRVRLLSEELRFQMDFFSAAVQNAFTTVFAGFAFTTTVFPNISLLPALVAGFRRVLIMQIPGMVNLPALFTSLVATLARVSKILPTSDFFRSCAVAMASARPVLVMTGLLDFMAFIGAILK